MSARGLSTTPAQGASEPRTPNPDDLHEPARGGRRAEKVLVNGAREKVVEMEGLSREMGEWSLLDEVGDMRGARRELDGHEAPARPLDNQVL